MDVVNVRVALDSRLADRASRARLARFTPVKLPSENESGSRIGRWDIHYVRRATFLFLSTPHRRSAPSTFSDIDR